MKCLHCNFVASTDASLLIHVGNAHTPEVKLKKNKPTPGPWGWTHGMLVGPCRPDGTVPISAKLILKDAKPVVRDADSRLIGKSPELLAAAKVLLEKLTGPLNEAVDAMKELQRVVHEAEEDDS